MGSGGPAGTPAQLEANTLEESRVETTADVKRALSMAVVGVQKLCRCFRLYTSRVGPDVSNFMSKRRRDDDTGSSSRSKKQKRDPSWDSSNPSSRQGPTSATTASVYSIRKVGANTVPSLPTVCLKSFVNDLIHQTSEKNNAKTIFRLKRLPEHLLSKVWSLLVSSWPQHITHAFIMAVFLRGSSIHFPSTLTGVRANTIQELSRMRESLVDLRITGFTFKDKVFATALARLLYLQHLNLRGCRNVSSLTCKVIAGTHKDLLYLNLGETNPTAADIKSIITSCEEIEVLKLSSLEAVTDLALTRLADELPIDEADNSSGPLRRLRSLKLRHTAITGTTVASMLGRLPLLERLDVSFVPLANIPLDITAPLTNMVKLSLSSTPIEARRLLPVLELMPNLQILNIGSLGSYARTAAGFTIGGKQSTSVTGMRTLNDATLYAMTDILQRMSNLESISLAGNSYLGLGKEGAIRHFLRNVGRRLKRLNLSWIPNLRSDDLDGLIQEEGDAQPCSLVKLILTGCNIDDQAAVNIAACPELAFLDLENTKISEDALFDIIDACPKLEWLNLTSCRRVNVQHRRRFFERWKEERILNREGEESS